MGFSSEKCEHTFHHYLIDFQHKEVDELFTIYELSSSQEYQILDNLLFVTEKYVINHENVRKEVEEMRKIKLMISEETRNLMKIENMEKQLEVKEQQLEEQKKETQRLLGILKEHNIATL